MARLLLLPSAAKLQLSPGERLLDALDEQCEQRETGLPLACRAANCGSCLLRVVRGASSLELAQPREHELLAQLGATADQRLGCQIVLACEPSEGELVLEMVEPRRVRAEA